MTHISQDDVQYLARLSNLELTDAETVNMQADLENIISYVEQLSQIDTTGVEPTYQVTDLKNIWREDKVDNYGVDRDDLLKLSPVVESNQIKVPKVL
ncbi:aspartyl/glutamyl-tRNA(Asn/Gln) amidotransferase subunit C [Candidatus Saccharibacteria bacterium 32-49-10]|nr:MAG: aspartyl/glutamyl-tRNA(Asn/Gln) amidotransferase subunit C [Candidatus Saccharibacteria bacterium 32-49-10]